MQRRGERALGPYPSGRKWQITTVGADGGRRHRYFAERRDAEDYKALVEARLAESRVTVGQAVDAYEQAMVEKENKPKSIGETMRRLRRYFAPRLKAPLQTLSEDWCRARYDELVAELATDSHRNILAECKTWLRWCVGERKWLQASPLEAVKGKGKRRHGKPQLHIDEARAWLAAALRLAHEEREGAIAGAMALLMGMRASEITERQARDVDDRGRILWIPDSKTDAGRRTVEVPEMLRPYLLELAEDKSPTEPLFGAHLPPWVRYWAHRIADLAQVPYVCPHGLRGTHASVAVDAGATSRIVAASIGHAHESVTETSYARRDALARGTQRRSLRVLEGGAENGEGPRTAIPGPSDDRPMSPSEPVCKDG